MTSLALSEEQLNKVLTDVEVLIQDVVSILDQDETAKMRLTDIKANPSIGKSEKELDDYLKNRGVKVD